MHGVVGQKSNAKFERRALKTQQKHEICTTLPAPISIPTPVPSGLRPSPLFVLRALYKCRMLFGLRRCKPFIFTNPRNEFFCAACHEEDGLVRADLGSHEACVHQDELILGPRASPRPYCMYQALVAWLYQAHNARIIMLHHMAQYISCALLADLCAKLSLESYYFSFLLSSNTTLRNSSPQTHFYKPNS